jgi:hypothetical protein
MSYLPNSIFVPDAKPAGKMRKKIKHHRVRTVRRREGERREVSRSVLLAAKALKIPLERVAPVDIEVFVSPGVCVGDVADIFHIFAKLAGAVFGISNLQAPYKKIKSRVEPSAVLVHQL